MKQWLKNYFIPHEDNDHKPHVLRTDTVLFFTIVTLGAEIYFLLQAFLLIPNGGLFGLISSNVLIDETNANRITAQESMLTPNPILIAAAEAKAKDMATKGYFAHTSPDGNTPWYWFMRVGYSFTYAGENLAVNFTDSKDVTNAWMNSPGHRANILNSHFTEIGIATAEGSYEGHRAVFVVELFGTPAPTAPSFIPTAHAAATVVASKKPATATIKTPTRSVTPAPIVIKEGSSSTNGTSELFVAVKSAEIGPNGATPALGGMASPRQAPTHVAVVRQANALETAIASPRTMVNYVLGFMAILMIVALLLNTLVKIRIQHPQLILNGGLLLLLIVCTFALNHYFSLSAIKIL